MRSWGIRASGSGILRCLTLTEFHLILQVCQVCWVKSLTLRFTAHLLSLSTEAMWRVVFVHLCPSGWAESGHPDPSARRKVPRAEDRLYLPTQRPEHLAQALRGADEMPPATTKAAITGKEKFQVAVWITPGTIPGLQSPLSGLSTKPAFGQNTSWQKHCCWWDFSSLKMDWRNYAHSIVIFPMFSFKIPLCSVFSPWKTQSFSLQKIYTASLPPK